MASSTNNQLLFQYAPSKVCIHQTFKYLPEHLPHLWITFSFISPKTLQSKQPCQQEFPTPSWPRPTHVGANQANHSKTAVAQESSVFPDNPTRFDQQQLTQIRQPVQLASNLNPQLAGSLPAGTAYANYLNSTIKCTQKPKFSTHVTMHI